MDDAAVARWDRPRWISVFSSHNPTIREVTECLGLGLSASSSTTNRGIPKFDNPEYRKLSGDVTRLSKELPKERDALLDFAADPMSLHHELEELLTVYGPAIWGRDTDRTCLLTPDPAKKTYPKHLFIEDPDDKRTLKIHLHRWIIIKACYYIRNMKLKRPSTANDYDTLADIEADADAVSPAKSQLVGNPPVPSSKSPSITRAPQSPNGTPPMLTPAAEGSTTAGAEYAVKPVNGKKRKSSAYASLSDGEEMESTPAKRQYQSHTMPISRKLARSNIPSIIDGPFSENIAPSVTANHSNGATNGSSTSDPGRPLLTPLSSNDLNGTARSANTAAPANGFTAVNTNGGSFTAVNASSPTKISPSPKPPVLAPAPNGRTYSSPYDSSPYGGSTMQQSSTPPKAPPLLMRSTSASGASAAGFQAINSPVVANGVSARSSPTVQHLSHPQLPSQHAMEVQPQPPSRSHTPIMHHHHRTVLTQQRSSRSSTPIAPPITSQPSHAVQSPQVQHPQLAAAPNAQPTATPPVQPPTGPPGPPAVAPRIQHANVPPVPAIPAAYHTSQHAPPVLRSHANEATAPPAQAPTAFDLGLLQCEILGLLMQYFFPSSSPPDEITVLQKVESLWHVGAPVFRTQIGQLYDLQSRALLTWTNERRNMAQLRHAIKYAPAVPAAEQAARLLALNDLRLVRLRWKNMSSAVGYGTEDLLCRTLATITNTEGTEYLFKDGLDKLSEGMFDFLKTEDMRILMHTAR